MDTKTTDAVRTISIFSEYDSPTLEDDIPLGFRSTGVAGHGHHQNHVRGASFWMLLLVSMPRMPVQMAWAAQWAALGPYLGTMLPKFAVQLTQFVGPLTGILVGPTTGVLSDRSTNPWGRRRPFLAIAGVLSVVCWILMGYTREMGEFLGDYGNGKPGVPTSRKWTATLTIFFYIWMDVTVNVVQTPVFLLVADMAGDRQTTGAALSQGWALLGSILVSAYIEIWGPAHLTLHWFLGMLCAMMFGVITVVCIVVKETPMSPDCIDTNKPALESIGEAFYSIYTGLRTLPRVLAVYCFIFFCVEYGYSAYTGNKGQFFGIVVYGGDATNADNCAPSCSVAQDNYNKGVQIAGGTTDLLFNSFGYLFSWVIPCIVRKFGAKRTLTLALVPQCGLVVMAFTKVVAINVLIVVVTTISQSVIFALIVPTIVHVFGDKADIGMYVGALNSANCFGMLLNFTIGAVVIETPMGYRLPVLLGGIMTLIGLLTSIFFLKLKMHSL